MSNNNTNLGSKNSIDGGLGIRSRNSRMEGADESTWLWSLAQYFAFLVVFGLQFNKTFPNLFSTSCFLKMTYSPSFCFIFVFSTIDSEYVLYKTCLWLNLNRGSTYGMIPFCQLSPNHFPYLFVLFVFRKLFLVSIWLTFCFEGCTSGSNSKFHLPHFYFHFFFQK